jgi:hypothetical protein
VARVVSLPHGLLQAGAPERTAALRAPTGADEAALLPGDLPRQQRLTRLLERCVTRIGEARPTREQIRALVAGDREALLLQLRAATWGDRLPCVVDCPACGERMDLDLSAGGLLRPGYDDPRETYALTLAGGARARFRLPDGADLEAAAAAGGGEPGARVLLARCVAEPERPSATQAAELEAEMERRDPQAEISLAMACPDCGAGVTAVLDAGGLLLDELAGSEGALLAEVHTIALHYHWSEADILALELPRRRRYLELLAGAAA